MEDSPDKVADRTAKVADSPDKVVDRTGKSEG